MNIITYILIAIIILLILLNVLIYRRYLNIKTEQEEDKQDFLYNKNKISMIEYQYRNFKEGMNAFTVLRNMSDILKDIYPTTKE